jgi:hypothetical protein
MPLLNPFYWFVALLSLAVVLLFSAGAGAAAYVIIRLAAWRISPILRLAQLPIGMGVAVATLALSCRGILWYADHPSPLRAKPSSANLQGVWTVTSASLTDMRQNGHYSISTHTLTFYADGSFELVNMPDWNLTASGESDQGFLSGDGRWSVIQDGDRWQIEPRFDRWSGIPDSLALPNRLNLFGWRDWGIELPIGDPDSGHSIIYEKSSP